MKISLVNKYILLVLVITFLGSCSGDSELSLEEQLNIDVAKIDAYIAANDLNNVQISGTGLRYVSNSVGNRELHEPGDFAVIHYEGKLLDGSVFDSSLDRDPFAFQVGTGSVIAGFDEGVRNINIEGSGIILIPSYLGYGSGGSGSIGANEVLVFNIQVLSDAQIIDMEFAEIDEYVSTSSLEDEEETESGIIYKITTAGQGDTAKDGDEVAISYKGYLLDGTVFDQSTTTTLDYTVGRDGLIDGWNESVYLLNEGAKGTFIIPSPLGYGRSGFNTIPPNTVLIFDIELVEIK
ncbi:MAG: FKBP-type peptidyl-prolyl cis-trans isomerase FkpA [Cyclobacteriaceae bacterium]|jgi:FKBP-type peptidyl-prolyl cis-trans isomerase